MKELSIEEKAKRYDEALKAAKDVYTYYCDDREQLRKIESIFPELKESEGEKTRKEITEFFKNYNEKGTWKAIPNVKKWIDWLEKQGSQDNDEDVYILHRFSFYSYKDEPNVLYLSGLYVNEEYRNKGIGTKILEVTDEVAKSLGYHSIRLKTKKNSDAERLYRAHGYNSLSIEDKDEIWLEKQVEQKLIDDAHEEAEKEKNDYVSGQFLYCKGSFNEFKEGESYWIEYIGNDTYIGRSDNILNQKFHITPRQLYTWLDPRHPEKQGEQKSIKEHNVCDFCEEKASCINPCPMKLVEHNSALSEEDEKVIHCLEYTVKHFYEDEDTIKWCCDWLKSLKDKVQLQNQWKPNDEQMKALENAMSMGAKLDSLYNDLKKLKG